MSPPGLPDSAYPYLAGSRVRLKWALPPKQNATRRPMCMAPGWVALFWPWTLTGTSLKSLLLVRIRCSVSLTAYVPERFTESKQKINCGGVVGSILNVSPNFSSDNFFYRRLAYAKHFPKINLCNPAFCIAFSNFTYVISL